MSDDECPPAGFESHWDAAWFRDKADRCRHLAGIAVDEQVKHAMLALSEDFRRQSEHAALLAAVVTAGREPPRR